MDECETWEQDCAQIKKHNKKLLAEFSIWLNQLGLAKKTNEAHYGNVDFYINNFLLYEEAVAAKDGTDMIGIFLGYWFIRKTVWASEYSIKRNITSIKKFYKFMLEKNLITTKQFAELKKIIKAEQSNWLGIAKRNNDPDINSMEEIWEF